MIGSRSCAAAILPGPGIHSMTSGSACFARENLKAGKWTFGVCPEVNLSCVVQPWDACPSPTSGVTRSRRFVLVRFKTVGDMICLTSADVAHQNQRCESRRVAYDRSHS